MNIILSINKLLNVKKIYLYDKSYIDIGNIKKELALKLLFEKNTTFFLNYNFKYIINYTNYFFTFNSNKDLNEYINKLLIKSKKIKIKSIKKMYNNLSELLLIILNNQNYDNLKIKIKKLDNSYYKNNSNDSIIKIINELFNETKLMLELLNDINNIYFYELFIKIFNEDSNKYNLIYKYIIKNNIDYIIYKNKKIKYNYSCIQKLCIILENNILEYTFD